MKIDIERAIEAMISAIETAARERSEYDRDPHDRQADRHAFRAQIDARRDSAIAQARATLAREAEHAHTLYEKLRRTSFDEAGVAAAWKRIETLLESGRGVDDVIARAGFDRNEAEAIRRNLSTWMASKIPEARPVDIERRVMPDLFKVQRAELRLMDQAEADATRGEHDRLAAADAVRAVDKMGVAAAIAGKVPAQELLEVGYAQIAASIAPPAKSWDQIVAEVDPEAHASAARNGLDLRLRGPLNENARQIGFKATEPAEPPLDLGG